MNKSDLVKEISQNADMSLRMSEELVSLMFDTMTSALIKDKRIEIRGFGSFSVRYYGTYEGRNPKTGEIIGIPEKRLPHFKAGKGLIEMINER